MYGFPFAGMGEFTPCNGMCSMSCSTNPVVDPLDVVCGRGQYLCPSDQKTCVPNADAYTQCTPLLPSYHVEAVLTV